MNAIQPSKPPLQPVEPRRVAHKRKRRRQANVATAVQSTVKISANIVLSVVAVSAIVKLVPYYLTQQQELQAIQNEVKLAEKRVQRLRVDFARSFDPQQARAIMQEQSNRFEPGQRPVFWQK